MKKTKEEGGRSRRIKVCRKSMWYASEKETLKENGNQYVGGVGLVAFAFQFAIHLLEGIISVYVFVMQHISIRLIFPAWFVVGQVSYGSCVFFPSPSSEDHENSMISFLSSTLNPSMSYSQRSGISSARCLEQLQLEF